ncbi:MAG: hypothetical protein EBS74_10355, partial [Flavobacteriia bacterium]|nr:hypothetical protein [Flavobacteriia bacterium]
MENLVWEEIRGQLRSHLAPHIYHSLVAPTSCKESEDGSLELDFENEFIKDGTTATNIWIGTTDAGANEGQWRWAGLEGTGDSIASDIPTISGVASTYYLNDVSPAVVADGYNW